MNVNELLKQIEKMDFSESTSYESAFRQFNTSLNYPTFTLPLKAGSIFYRSRTHQEFSQFSKLNDLRYPPEEYIKNFGRANRPFQSFLYTSDTPETTYMELLPHWGKMDLIEGDAISVTTVEYTTSEDVFITLIPNFNNLKMAGFIEKIRDRISEQEEQILGGINNMLGKTILDDPNIYIQTSAFFNTLRVMLETKQPKSQGFIFTSVQNLDKKKSGWNMVLNPDAANRICKVQKVFKRTFKIIERKGQWISVYPLSDEPNTPVNFDPTSETIQWQKSL